MKMAGKTLRKNGLRKKWSQEKGSRKTCKNGPKSIYRIRILHNSAEINIYIYIYIYNNTKIYNAQTVKH